MKDLLAQDGNQFDDSTRKLLAFLRDGRSLFGKRIITGWSYYAFLTAAEVRELAAGIRSTQKANPKLTDQNYFDGFLIALLGWLDKIGRRKMDLFLYTA